MIQPARHALIIEDEIIIALEIETLLADLGFATFDVADCPRAALAAAQAHCPDLITADYRIHEGTGVEAVAAILQALGAIPVVYVTGNGSAICSNFPMVDKPIRPSALAKACLQASFSTGKPGGPVS